MWPAALFFLGFLFIFLTFYSPLLKSMPFLMYYCAYAVSELKYERLFLQSGQ